MGKARVCERPPVVGTGPTHQRVGGAGPHGTPRAPARGREWWNASQRLYPAVRITRFTWADPQRSGYILELVKGEERGDLTEME